MEGGGQGSWSENILDYFLNIKQIKTRDGAEIIWYHRANSKLQMREAIKSNVHMIEADVLGKKDGEPIMAHPPETSSDNTLKEWLTEIQTTNKGVKLDFKSLEAVNPSMKILGDTKLKQPVWINADILPGPNGSNCVIDAKGFLSTVTSFFPDVTLSLGWTTGWTALKCSKGKNNQYIFEYPKGTKSHLILDAMQGLPWLLLGLETVVGYVLMEENGKLFLSILCLRKPYEIHWIAIVCVHREHYQHVTQFENFSVPGLQVLFLINCVEFILEVQCSLTYCWG
uniref:Family with sequence similarity 151 member B n=1 Tax=Anolis carolinensis TaxID=28377 RepID=A0A803TAY8_ANOCA